MKNFFTKVGSKIKHAIAWVFGVLSVVFSAIGKFLFETFARIKAETPSYHKKIGNFFAWLAGLAILLQPEATQYVNDILDFFTSMQLTPPAWLQHAGKWISVIGITAKFYSFITVKSSEVVVKVKESDNDTAIVTGSNTIDAS